jgi:hypothetical protein
MLKLSDETNMSVQYMELLQKIATTKVGKELASSYMVGWLSGLLADAAMLPEMKRKMEDDMRFFVSELQS